MSKHTQSRRSGFTLVELMVVAIIVAILAAVAIPLMSGNKKRAMATEAEAALGTMRSQLRAMYAETGAYNKKSDTVTLTAPTSPTNISGIAVDDLKGKYWSEPDYKLSAVSATAYTLTATGTGEVANVVITLNEAGTFTRTGL